MMEPDRKRIPEEREACFRSRRFRARRERCGAVAETPHFTKKVPGVYCAKCCPVHGGWEVGRSATASHTEKAETLQEREARKTGKRGRPPKKKAGE